VRGCIGAEVCIRFARRRAAASRTALVEQNCAIDGRVDAPARSHRTSRTRAAVQEKSRLAAGVTGAFEVHVMTVADVEEAALERLDCRKFDRHAVAQ
jgi:hypothetical protein